jgi:hypothetical protein
MSQASFMWALLVPICISAYGGPTGPRLRLEIRRHHQEASTQVFVFFLFLYDQLFNDLDPKISIYFRLHILIRTNGNWGPTRTHPLIAHRAPWFTHWRKLWRGSTPPFYQKSAWGGMNKRRTDHPGRTSRYTRGLRGSKSQRDPMRGHRRTKRQTPGCEKHRGCPDPTIRPSPRAGT